MAKQTLDIPTEAAVLCASAVPTKADIAIASWQ
jgi:hypothetical protein